MHRVLTILFGDLVVFFCVLTIFGKNLEISNFFLHYPQYWKNIINFHYFPPFFHNFLPFFQIYDAKHTFFKRNLESQHDIWKNIGNFHFVSKKVYVPIYLDLTNIFLQYVSCSKKYLITTYMHFYSKSSAGRALLPSFTTSRATSSGLMKSLRS